MFRVLTETGNILQRIEQTIHHIARLPNVFWQGIFRSLFRLVIARTGWRRRQRWRFERRTVWMKNAVYYTLHIIMSTDTVFPLVMFNMRVTFLSIGEPPHHTWRRPTPCSTCGLRFLAQLYGQASADARLVGGGTEETFFPYIYIYVHYLNRYTCMYNRDNRIIILKCICCVYEYIYFNKNIVI